MKLTFLGTRGNIEARTDRHQRHTSMLVSYYGRDVMIDAGEDWLEHIDDVKPDAIVITHSHPDHAWGLKKGAPCPVWAPEIAWEEMASYPIEEKHTIAHREPTDVLGISFEAFPVEHSTLAPAVGYRITAGEPVVFYASDVVYIEDRAEALAGARIYIGDGATISRSMVRLQGENLVGHAPVRTQLTWCQKEGVPRAVFTHCGYGIVGGDEREIVQEVEGLALERGVEAEIAYDGMEIILR